MLERRLRFRRSGAELGLYILNKLSGDAGLGTTLGAAKLYRAPCSEPQLHDTLQKYPASASWRASVTEIGHVM